MILHIYVDNFKLRIQAQKAYAEKYLLQPSFDQTWQFDVGHLKDMVIKNTTISPDDDVHVNVNLYGTIPPPVDTVWTSGPRVWSG